MKVIGFIFTGLIAMHGLSWAQYDCTQCPDSTVPFQVCVPNDETELADCFTNLNTLWYEAICLRPGAVYPLTGSLAPVENTNLTVCGNGAVIERDKNNSPKPFRILNVSNATLSIEETTFYNGRPAVLNSGSALLTIQDSTFAHNTPALAVRSSTTTNIYNSTFADNYGGVKQKRLSATNIYNSTFSKTKGHILDNSDDSTMTVTSSILDGTCAGVVLSEGANVSAGCALSNLQAKGQIDLDDAGLGGLQDQIVFDAGLGDRLWYNGGPTPTISLRRGSPAIGAGSCSVATDQRGVLRKSTCDSGALETLCDTNEVVGDTLNVYLIADFTHPGGSPYQLQEPSPYALLNDGSCELETIESDIGAISWYLQSFDGGRPKEPVEIYNIYFTESPTPTSFENCSDPNPPPENSCPDARGIVCINNCLTSSGFSTGPVNHGEGAPLYTLNLDLQFKDKDCPCLFPDPSNCPDLDPADPDACYSLPWSYTVQWSDNFDNGNWDPRMRAVIPPPPTR